MDKVASMPLLPMPGQGSQNPKQMGATDFWDRLNLPAAPKPMEPNSQFGVPNRNQPSVGPPPSRDWSQEVLLRVDQTTVVAQDSPDARGDEQVAELHRFGAFAVNQLSYLPRLFGAETVSGSGSLAAVSAVRTEAGAAGPSGLAQNMRQGNDESTLAVLSAQLPLRPGTAAERSSTVGGTEIFLPTMTSTWAPRRLRLQETAAGTDVIVRDYHIGEAGHAALLSALRETLQQQGVQPYRIWLNGHVVWQAQPLTN